MPSLSQCELDVAREEAFVMTCKELNQAQLPKSKGISYLRDMDLLNAALGMCQLAKVELDQVSNFRIRRGLGQQDVYMELHANQKKCRAYINAAEGQISEIDVREVHDNRDSSKLLDVANQLAEESATMDAYRLGISRP